MQDSLLNYSTDRILKPLRPLIKLNSIDRQSLSVRSSVKASDSKSNLMTNLAKLKKFEPLIKQKSVNRKNNNLKQDIYEEPIKEVYQSNYNTQKSDKNFLELEEHLNSYKQDDYQKIMSQVESYKVSTQSKKKEIESFQNDNENLDIEINDTDTIGKDFDI